MTRRTVLGGGALLAGAAAVGQCAARTPTRSAARADPAPNAGPESPLPGAGGGPSGGPPTGRTATGGPATASPTSSPTIPPTVQPAIPPTIPPTRTWLSGYSGSGGPAVRAAWAGTYFPAQVWTAYLDVGTSLATTGVASIAFNRSQFLAPRANGSVVNVLTIPLIPSAAAALDPTGLAAGARGADVDGWSAIGHALRARGLDSPSTVLRIGHEPNGYWFPWCTDNRPAAMAEYRRAWRHAHTAIRAECPAVRFCLCLNKNLGGRAAIAGHYAGDAYVDLLGLDFYDFGHATTAAEFAATQGSLGFAEIAAFAHAREKLFSLDEWGVGGGSDAPVRDNPFYVRSIFGALAGLQEQYCDLVAFDSYFDEPGGFALAANPRSAAAYRSLWTARAAAGTVARTCG